MLACAGLGDDALLTHAFRYQGLAERVVDLVSSGVREILALEVDLRPARLLRQPLREVERGRASNEITEQARVLFLKRRISLRLLVLSDQIAKRGHQRLRDELPAERTEPTVLVR